MTDTNVNTLLVDAIASGALEVVDLTETLREEYPTLKLPDQFGQAWGFKKELISRYDDNGPAWYWHNFSMSEHTGTHFDAPAHWVSGKDVPDNTVDTMPSKDFIAPVCVIDCTKEVKADPDFILTKDFMLKWEAEHGKIEAGSWVFLRSDWRKVVTDGNYTMADDNGTHNPGPDAEACQWMVNERDIFGFGTECVGTDSAQAATFDPPYPAHYFVHGAGKYGLQCMTNLDLLPPKGAVVIASPLKIEDGSGSPLRVIALAPKK